MLEEVGRFRIRRTCRIWVGEERLQERVQASDQMLEMGRKEKGQPFLRSSREMRIMRQTWIEVKIVQTLWQGDQASWMMSMHRVPSLKTAYPLNYNSMR